MFTSCLHWAAQTGCSQAARVGPEGRKRRRPWMRWDDGRQGRIRISANSEERMPQRPGADSRGQQGPAEASRGQQRPAGASRGQQRPAEASRGQQRPAEASSLILLGTTNVRRVRCRPRPADSCRAMYSEAALFCTRVPRERHQSATAKGASAEWWCS
ncbi:hypothetical protein DL89DRAFT_18242 [Linderina pennispora]|uniref:Uncharacterized protein n=1 Tax=Linderina pennispora TaxID=61395 RepID=A0A1Y1WMJ5_9FUNG|nr:uncharacterized protein DL89DRAFT_18242 [Linderina pennispora]ORX74508.1 hypothetical protein DL89DRAFT_18242 [Linderina pennispora]